MHAPFNARGPANDLILACPWVRVLPDQGEDLSIIGPQEYERMFGVAVRDLLARRGKGETVSHEEAKAKIAEILARHDPGR